MEVIKKIGKDSGKGRQVPPLACTVDCVLWPTACHIKHPHKPNREYDSIQPSWRWHTTDLDDAVNLVSDLLVGED